MNKQKIKRSILFIFILSLLGWACWIYEICVVHEWHGLTWLSKTLYSPYIGLLFAALSFLIPFLFSGSALKKIVLPMLLLYLVNLFCYLAGKEICLLMYCRFCPWSTAYIITFLSVAFLLFPLMGFSYWLITAKFIRKNKKINILYISLLIFTAIVLSNLTIYINPGFGSQTGWVDVVKMGYPVFWTLFVLGFCGIIISKQKTIA
ncbi:MAG: hypothetical protein H0W73_11225 [Bacteroidetes bacterium]|nr:hypothetical protein [Bacteroidota bacterium]